MRQPENGTFYGDSNRGLSRSLWKTTARTIVIATYFWPGLYLWPDLMITVKLA